MLRTVFCVTPDSTCDVARIADGTSNSEHCTPEAAGTVDTNLVASASDPPAAGFDPNQGFENVLVDFFGQISRRDPLAAHGCALARKAHGNA
jgi:hypothetical protein